MSFEIVIKKNTKNYILNGNQPTALIRCNMHGSLDFHKYY